MDTVPELVAIAANINSPEADRREAIRLIALLLERHCCSRAAGGVFETSLPAELLEIELLQGDLHEITTSMCTTALKEPASGGLLGELFWLLGKTCASESGHAVQTIVDRLESDVLGNHALRQGLIAVENLAPEMPLNERAAIGTRISSIEPKIINHQSEENKRIVGRIVEICSDNA